MKRNVIFSCALLALLTACPEEPSPVPDAGISVDESCGIDCETQKAYGLVQQRCFEFSSTSQVETPPALGVFIRQVTEVEGGLKTLQVEYRRNGQILMTDYVRPYLGELLLVRRTYADGQRVQYQDGPGGDIVGIPWATVALTPGDTFTNTRSASVLTAGQEMAETTSLKVTATEPDVASELTTPLQAFDAGVKLIFAEMPDHGMDSRRIWVKDTGFVSFSSRLAPGTSGSSQTYKLQAVRTVAASDVECGSTL